MYPHRIFICHDSNSVIICLGSWVDKEEGIKGSRATLVVGRKCTRGGHRPKVVKLSWLAFTWYVCLCVDVYDCFDELYGAYVNDWSSVSNNTMAMSMLYETWSIQVCHYASMNLCKQACHALSLYLVCLVSQVCYWDSAESHPPPPTI